MTISLGDNQVADQDECERNADGGDAQDDAQYQRHFPQELVRAIHQVHRGEANLHPAIAQKLLNEIGRKSEQPLSEEPLTEREVDVLKLVARGLSDQQIADKLVVSIATVYTHVSNILAKLYLASQNQAALFALRERYSSLYDEG